jgi:pentatricopeptide repeat protein
MLFLLHLSCLISTVAYLFYVFLALFFMQHNPFSVYFNSHVLQVMLVCGKYNLVYEFFKKVEKSSIPGALNYKGSSYNFNLIMLQCIIDISDLLLFVVLVNALWRERKIDEAVMAVKDMESRGIVGSASLYYDLARCLCSVGRCKEALLQVCAL